MEIADSIDPKPFELAPLSQFFVLMIREMIILPPFTWPSPELFLEVRVPLHRTLAADCDMT